MSQQEPATEEHTRPKRAVNRGWYALLVLPFVATLVPPFYARIEPKLGGWPFFYWWQFLWIVITSLILALVYKMTTVRAPKRGDRAGRAAPPDPSDGPGRPGPQGE